MKTSLFTYIEYAFRTLFSNRFFAIVGSSLILSFLSIWVYLGSIYGISLYLSGIFASMNPGADGILPLLGGFLIFLLILTSLSVLLKGWYAIIIPIRSIDGTKKFDIMADYRLYKKHIGTYFGYLLWYALIWLGIIVGYILLLVLTSALSPWLGWTWGIGGIGVILYTLTRMTLTWYHMLSEGSISYKTWSGAIKMTAWRVWKIFYQILGYSIIIWIASGLIESLMGEILSLFGIGNFADAIGKIILENKENIETLIGELGRFFTGERTTVLLTSLWFGMWYSVSSVLSRAMFSIFYVRYYLDVREDYHDEHSFIKKSLLIQSSHR